MNCPAVIMTSTERHAALLAHARQHDCTRQFNVLERLDGFMATQKPLSLQQLLHFIFDPTRTAQ